MLTHMLQWSTSSASWCGENADSIQSVCLEAGWSDRAYETLNAVPFQMWLGCITNYSPLQKCLCFRYCCHTCSTGLYFFNERIKIFFCFSIWLDFCVFFLNVWIFAKVLYLIDAEIQKKRILHTFKHHWSRCDPGCTESTLSTVNKGDEYD